MVESRRLVKDSARLRRRGVQGVEAGVEEQRRMLEVVTHEAEEVDTHEVVGPDITLRRWGGRKDDRGEGDIHKISTRLFFVKTFCKSVKIWLSRSGLCF